MPSHTEAERRRSEGNTFVPLGRTVPLDARASVDARRRIGAGEARRRRGPILKDLERMPGPFPLIRPRGETFQPSAQLPPPRAIGQGFLTPFGETTPQKFRGDPELAKAWRGRLGPPSQQFDPSLLIGTSGEFPNSPPWWREQERLWKASGSKLTLIEWLRNKRDAGRKPPPKTISGPFSPDPFGRRSPTIRR